MYRSCLLLIALLILSLGCQTDQPTVELAMPDVVDSLKTAIAEDDADAVQNLVQGNPSLMSSSMDGEGRSLLHLAAHHDARRSAKVLFDAGADFYARDANGQLALDLRPGDDDNATRGWLREINASRNEFLGAVCQQEADKVRELLTQNPSLAHARDIGDGWPAAMMACHFGNEAILEALIEAGAALDGTDFHTGYDAVQQCAERGEAGCLRRLLDAGVEPTGTWRIDYGSLPMEMNALHLACWKGHAEVVAILLEAGLNPNARARSYAMLTPLHLAAEIGHADVVRRLLDAGADAKARDGRRGVTALAMAAKHPAAAELLGDR